MRQSTLRQAQSNDAYSWNGHVTIDRAYSTNGLNQYVSAGAAAFCYDANGKLTADGASVYLYDVENRLVEKRVQGAGNTNCAALTYTGALQAELKYDPTGRLYQVSGGTLGTQRFAYDGNAMIGEYYSVGNMLRRYVHGSNSDWAGTIARALARPMAPPSPISSAPSLPERSPCHRAA